MRNSHNERAVHEYRRDKSCKWVSVQRSCIVLWSAFPNIQVTAKVFGSLKASVTFCSIFWPVLVHAHSGSLWIQSVWAGAHTTILFKALHFLRCCWDWEQICGTAELLAGKIHVVLCMIWDYAGTSNVHHKQLTDHAKHHCCSTVLPCRQRCLDWAVLFLGIDGKSWCSVNEIIFAQNVIQVKGANFIQITKNYYKSCFKDRLFFFPLQETNILHTEPASLKCIAESTCEWDPELA